MFVETADGFAVRQILPASLLPPDEPVGPAAESATRNAAARWGLPDFVFRPALHRRGRGVREAGDAIVVSAERAASVQVKARVAPTTHISRERRWLDKNIARGARQSAGTIRSLKSARSPMVNLRGRHVIIDGSTKR